MDTSLVLPQGASTLSHCRWWYTQMGFSPVWPLLCPSFLSILPHDLHLNKLAVLHQVEVKPTVVTFVEIPDALSFPMNSLLVGFKFYLLACAFRWLLIFALVAVLALEIPLILKKWNQSGIFSTRKINLVKVDIQKVFPCLSSPSDKLVVSLLMAFQVT